jgi:hypothetical protein
VKQPLGSPAWLPKQQGGPYHTGGIVPTASQQKFGLLNGRARQKPCEHAGAPSPQVKELQALGWQIVPPAQWLACVHARHAPLPQ